MIRALWVALVTIFSTVRYGTPVVYHARRRSHKLKRLAREYPRLWTQKILRAARVKVEVEGREHLETATPCVLVANHQSWFDVLALAGWLPSNYRFVAKKELESVPFFGPGWQALGHISIDRRDRQSAIESLERAARLVREESRVIVMFPEGTRSPDGEVKAFKKGAFVLAIRARGAGGPGCDRGDARDSAQGFVARPTRRGPSPGWRTDSRRGARAQGPGRIECHGARRGRGAQGGRSSGGAEARRSRSPTRRCWGSTPAGDLGLGRGVMHPPSRGALLSIRRAGLAGSRAATPH